MEKGHQAVDLGVLEGRVEELRRCYDQQAGIGVEGVLRHSGNEAGVTIQVFPDTGIARLQSQLTQVTLRRVELSRDEHDNVLYLRSQGETEWTEAKLYHDGRMMLTQVPTNRHGVAADATVGSAAETLPSDPAAEKARHDRDGAGRKERGERERVTLVGRVGSAPFFRTSAKGTLVGSFPLRAHDETGETAWHQIVIFGERAQKVQQNAFAKGQEVEVIGYLHQWERRLKSGESKQVEEVYAAVVKEVKTKPAEGSQREG